MIKSTNLAWFVVSDIKKAKDFYGASNSFLTDLSFINGVSIPFVTSIINNIDEAKKYINNKIENIII